MEGNDELARFDALTRKKRPVGDSIPAVGGDDELAQFDRLTGRASAPPAPATPDSTLHQQGDIVLPGAATPAPRRGRIAGIAAGINDFLSKDRAPAISAAVSSVIPDVTLENFQPIPGRAAPGRPPRIDERLLTQRPDASDVVTPAMAEDRAAATRKLSTGGYDRAKVEQAAELADLTARDPDAPAPRRKLAAALANNLRQQMLAEDARGGPFQKVLNAFTLHGINQGPDLTLRGAAEAGMLATPEDLADIGVRDPSGAKRATQPGFDAAEMAYEGVGQLPYFMAGGAVARSAAALGLEALPELGLAADGKIAHALGRVAEGLETTAPRGTMARTGQRLVRGASQGALVGPAVQYASERQSGATPEEAAIGAALNTAFGAVLGGGAEVAGGLLGDTGAARLFMYANDASRAVGAQAVIEAALRNRGDAEGFIREMQPYVARGRRMVDEQALGGAAIRDEAGRVDATLTARATAAAEAAREAAGKTPVGDKMPEAQAKTIATLLQQALEQKREASGGVLPPPPAREEPLIAVPEQYGGARETRGIDNTPLPTAQEVGLRNAGLQPHEEADATVQMARAADEQAAMQAELARQANDPTLRLEQAAQAAPGNVQGPRTLRETLEDTKAGVEQGEPLATGYHDAINRYVDALAAVQDAGEKGPNTRTQIALARARAALNDARTKYGKQLGASAVLALAANNDDLTDDEKKLVGLGALAIGSTRVVRALGEDAAQEYRRFIQTFPEHSTAEVGEWLQHLVDAGLRDDDQWRIVRDELGVQAGTTSSAERITREQVLRALTPDAERGGLTPAQVAEGLGVVEGRLQVFARPDEYVRAPSYWANAIHRGAGLTDEQAGTLLDFLRNQDELIDDNGMMSLAGLRRALGVEVPAAQEAVAEPEGPRFYSRLQRHVESLPKKWDTPQPAAVWRDFLGGKGKPYSAEEYERFLKPELDRAAANKQKLAKADVARMIEEHRPLIEEHRLTSGGRDTPSLTLAPRSPEEEPAPTRRRGTVSRDYGPAETAVRDDYEAAVQEALGRYDRAEQDYNYAHDAMTTELANAGVRESAIHHAMNAAETGDGGIDPQTFLDDLIDRGELEVSTDPELPGSYDMERVHGDSGYRYEVTDAAGDVKATGTTRLHALANAEAAGVNLGTNDTLLAHGQEIVPLFDTLDGYSHEVWVVRKPDGTDLQLDEGTGASDNLVSYATRENAERAAEGEGDGYTVYKANPNELEPERWGVRDGDEIVYGADGAYRDVDDMIRDLASERDWRVDTDLGSIRSAIEQYANEREAYNNVESDTYSLREETIEEHPDFNDRLEEAQREDEEARIARVVSAGGDETWARLDAPTRAWVERMREQGAIGTMAPLVDDGEAATITERYSGQDASFTPVYDPDIPHTPLPSPPVERPPMDPHQVELFDEMRGTGVSMVVRPEQPVTKPGLKATGSAKWSGTQVVPGGERYRELLLVYENNPGAPYNGSNAASHNHYRGTSDNVIGHLRLSDRRYFGAGEEATTPGLQQVRAQREATLAKLRDIEDEYAKLPPAQRTNPNDPETRRLYDEYMRLNKVHEEQGKLEEAARNQLPSRAQRRPELVTAVEEAQSDWYQDANRDIDATTLSEVTRYDRKGNLLPTGFRRPVDLPPEELARLKADADTRFEAAVRAAEDADKTLRTANVAYDEAMRTMNALREEAQQRLVATHTSSNSRMANMVRGIREALAGGGEPPPYAFHDATLDEATNWYARYEAADNALQAADDARGEASSVWSDAVDAQDVVAREREAVGIENPHRPPDTPFNDADKVYGLLMGRLALEGADADADRIAWSHSSNRVAMASLPLGAAKVTYDVTMTSAIKKLLAGLGFKDVKPEIITMSGYAWWSVPLSAEMKAAIKKAGVPTLAVLAALLPRQSEAQDGSSVSSPLYTTVAGTALAGAAIAALAGSRALRRLVKENRELNRALMVDDLTGLANQRAFRRAVEAVDRDPHTAWIAFDADNFKALNDTHGHPEGDKALAHFGQAIRQAAKTWGVPLRAFRSGGDEFAFAVEQAHAATLARAIEQMSRYEKGGVTTKLTGSWGWTHAEADAGLVGTKAIRRSASSVEMVASPAVKADDGRLFGPTERGGGHLGAAKKAQAAGVLANYAWNRPDTRGFVTTHGRYVSRAEALTIAERAGQVTPHQAAELRAFWKDFPDSPHHGLGSEDISPERYGDVPNGVILYANPLGAALRELRRAPGAATVGIAGALALESDNPDIQKAGKPFLALAMLSAIGSDRLIAGKDALAGKLVDVLSRSEDGKATVRFFNPSALLSDEVKAAIGRFEEGRARAKARATEFYQKAKALGPEGDRAASDVLDSEQWEDTRTFTPEQHAKVLAVAVDLQQEYNRLAAEKVAAGVLDPRSVIPNYGGARKYAFFEANRALANSPRGGGRTGATGAARIGAQKARTLDIPIHEAEREVREAHLSGDPQAIRDAEDKLDEARAVQLSQRVERGEIREASYRAAYTIEKGYADVEAAKLFDALRTIPGTAHPEWVGAVDDIRAATQLLKQAATQADHDTAKAMLDEAKVRLAEVQRRFKREHSDWTTLPDSPGMGAMAGAVVQRDVANELKGFAESGGRYGKLLRFWKEAKTVFNPGTHAANIVSNISFAHMEGLGIHEQPVYLVRAAKDMKAYGAATRALAERGILEQSAINATQEGAVGGVRRGREALEELLPTTRPETQDVLRREGINEQTIARNKSTARARGAIGGLALGAALGASADDNGEGSTALGAIGAVAGAAMAGRRASFRNFYQGEDNIFRVAIYLKRRALGDSEEAAARYTRDALGNFRSRSPALNIARQSIAPFLLYPAKALPRFAQKMIDHPIRYLSLVAAWAYVNEQAKQDVGEVPESDIAQKDRHTALGYFLPGFTQLPFTNERGERAAVDMARWTALSGATTMAPPGSVPASVSPHVPAVFNAGGPAVDLAARFGANVDTYSGKPAYKTDYPPRENISRLLNDVAETALPQVLGLHRERLTEDAANADWDKFKNDLLGVGGVKPRYIRPGANIRGASYQLEQSLASMKHDLQTDLINNRRPERTTAITERYNRRIANALANFLDRVGAPPPAALVHEYLDPAPDESAAARRP